MFASNERGAMSGRWIPILALSLIAAPALVAQSTPRAARITTRCVHCDPADSAAMAARLRFDSLRMEFEHRRLSDGEREALALQMARALRDLEAVLAEERATTETRRRAPWARGNVLRQMPNSYTVVVQQSDHGYLGVSFDGPNYEYTTDDDHVIRFYQYPRIALVEPASPAERAGIVPGDTLIALNQMDVVRTGEISLTKILVPERRLDVLLRRDGNTRTLPVTVGRAPDYVVRRMTPAPVPELPSRERRMDVPEPPRGRVSVGTRATSFVYADGVGGAELATVTAGLARALGVSSGVLVVRVPVGTPAHESGLRDGDVIRRVGREEIASIGELRRVLDARRDESGGVRLVIMRDGSSREVTLRW